MANCQTSNTNISPINRTYVCETIIKLDQMQKAANVDHICEGCEGSLSTDIFNTKPCQFYLRSGNKLEVDIPESDECTSFFRIESVRDDAVILRLLDMKHHDDDRRCTNFTVVLLMDCICCLQCFPPICCRECKRCININ